jgi:NAD(P)-dependent dehydrogenase (short-subunit alcohol dehydrogenase family)
MGSSSTLCSGRNNTETRIASQNTLPPRKHGSKPGSFHTILGCRSSFNGAAAVQQLLSEQDNSISPTDLSFVGLDISDDSIIEATRYLGDTFGRLDILIINAATPGPDGLFGPRTTSLRDSCRKVLEINLFGTATVIEKFLHLLHASIYHDRRIVNATSGLGRVGLAYS